jgi:hypothetical protein
MAVYVRKNSLIFTAVFSAADGTATQPTNVYARLRFKNTSGATTEVSIPLTYGSTGNNWTGSWDSSAAAQGNVDWVVYGNGSLEAAQQGSFQISANSANDV